MRILIVGAGVIGLSTAWALVGEGHEVAIYEQGPIPNPAAEMQLIWENSRRT